jgi:quinohemoprotein ethanol dehydrogenase
MASNGTSRLLVYKLGGTASHPIEPIVLRMTQAPPTSTGTEAQIAQGRELFLEHCARCHGVNVGSGGVVQDLRYLDNAKHQIFKQIVLEGVYSGLGMVSFAEQLDEGDADNIQHYLIQQGNLTWEAQNSSGWWHEFSEWFYEQTGRLLGSLMAL